VTLVAGGFFDITAKSTLTRELARAGAWMFGFVVEDGPEDPAPPRLRHGPRRRLEGRRRARSRKRRPRSRGDADRDEPRFASRRSSVTRPRASSCVTRDASRTWDSVGFRVLAAGHGDCEP
jgi:hypothetical protein